MARTSLFWATLISGASALLAVGCGGSAEIKFVGEPDTSFCGDGTIDSDEKCDDGNKEAGDGCSDKCAIEPGYVCTGKSDSSCALTCGNDEFDTGESCDDGNLTKGDGCDETCQAEGSCEAPLVLDVSSGSASIDSSTASGGSFVEAVDCGGDTAGAGPDRVFQFEITETSDVTISLSSSFNGLVRLRSSACDDTTEVACTDASGAGGEETLKRSSVDPGIYFIVVDGNSDTASGDFTLNVDLACPVSGLKIQEIAYNPLGWEGTRYITLVNKATCTLSLSQFVLGTRSYAGAMMVNNKLPSKTLAAGKSFVIGSNSANLVPAPNMVADSANYNPTSSDIAICVGNCDTSDGSNIVDYFVNGDFNGTTTTAPALPDGVTFTGGPLTAHSGSYETFAVHRRVKFAGRAPKFSAADWKSGYVIDPDKGLSSGNIGLYTYSFSTGTPNCTVVDDAAPTANEGRYIVVKSGTTSQWQGCYVGLGPYFKPKTVHYRSRTSGGGSYYASGVSFQNAYSATADWWTSNTNITWFFTDYFYYGLSYAASADPGDTDSYVPLYAKTTPAFDEWFDIDQSINWDAGTVSMKLNGEDFADNMGTVVPMVRTFDATKTVEYLMLETNFTSSEFHMSYFETFD